LCVLIGISGERIWVEVKKIATGRYADSIFRVMQELGVTKHIGLHVVISIFSSDIVYMVIVHYSINLQCGMIQYNTIQFYIKLVTHHM